MANARRAAPEHLTSIRRLVAAGVTLTNGTDYPPGQQVAGISAIATEAALMCGAGLTPLQALQSLTVHGAALVRLADRIGAITPGYQADLVLLADDPTRDVAALAGVRTVIARGRPVQV